MQRCNANGFQCQGPINIMHHIQSGRILGVCSLIVIRSFSNFFGTARPEFLEKFLLI